MMILPRQARNKHRESTQKRARRFLFCRVGAAYRLGRLAAQQQASGTAASVASDVEAKAKGEDDNNAAIDVLLEALEGGSGQAAQRVAVAGLVAAGPAAVGGLCKTLETASDDRVLMFAVRKEPHFSCQSNHVLCKKDHFTKTGSGQTYPKVRNFEQNEAFCCRRMRWPMRCLAMTARMLRGPRRRWRRCGKRRFCAILY